MCYVRAENKICEEQDRRKNQADQDRRRTEAYEVGDKVLVKTRTLSDKDKGIAAKLAPKRDGPYVIRHRCSPTSYEIADEEGNERYGEISRGRSHAVCHKQYFEREPGAAQEETRPPQEEELAIGSGTLPTLEGECVASPCR